MGSDAPAPSPPPSIEAAADPSEVAAAPRPALRGWVRWLGTMLGSGFSPIMPGTCGTVVALLAVGFIPDPFFAPTCLALALTATLTGPRLADRFIASSGRHDPQAFVFDEAAGLWLACLRLDHPGWFSLFVSFALFRVLDMAKPWPVGRLERLPGGRGVVYDDVAAGLIALAIAWPLHLAYP